MVVGCHSSEENARTVLESLPGGGHIVARLSIEDSASIAAFRDRMLGEMGGVYILVNSAGVTRPVPYADLDALIDQVFVNNWRGVFSGSALSPRR